MKKRLNHTFLLVSAIIITLMVILFSFVFYQLLGEEVNESLQNNALILENALEASDDESEVVKKMNFENLRVTIVDKEGKVIFDNFADTKQMDNHKDRPEIDDALETGEGSCVRHSDTLAKNTFYYALRMAEDMDSIEEKDGYKELVPFIRKIKTQHEDIMKSAKMRQVFTANVSHELKTPLTSISGYAELIENGMAADDDVRRFAKEIHRNSKRLLTLINDTIRLSELDMTEKTIEFEDIDLYELAENCVSMLQINAEKHQVFLSLFGSSCHVCANKGMMEELLYNLCDNAIRYNKADGSVKVILKNEEDCVKLQVKDTGIGIPQKSTDRVFERFYRVDKSRSKQTGGTGLGLAIVKHIVAKHNAKITLSSELGKGTTITVIFPKNTLQE